MKKARLYEIVSIVWWILSFGVAAGIALVLSSAPRASGGFGVGFAPLAFVGMVLIGLGGSAAIQLHENRTWRRAGHQVQLSPENGRGFLRKPVLIGSINGRTVRARATGGWLRMLPGGTVVETELDRPIELGFVVATTDKRWSQSRVTSKLEPERAATRDDRFVVYGHSESIARALISGCSREALLAINGEVYIGDASDAVATGTSLSETALWPLFEKPWTWGVPETPSTVSIRTGGTVVDSDRLKRQSEAVVAVADAVEETTAVRET